MRGLNRSNPSDVALETTVLVHGVPREDAAALARDLAEIVRAEGVAPAFIGLFHGRPIVGMNDSELAELIRTPVVAKVNTPNMGVHMLRGDHGATTVSATMELAAMAGLRVFATGGIGGVHRGLATRLDISADLAAFARFPIAVVSSGVKSILDVESTREALESLGIPVIGFGTDVFPAFYRRESDARVDARFDDAAELAQLLLFEMERTGRGILVANPIAARDELSEKDWSRWLAEAMERAESEGAKGRDVTPRALALLHGISGGATLRANLALLKANTRLAAALGREMSVQHA